MRIPEGRVQLPQGFVSVNAPIPTRLHSRLSEGFTGDGTTDRYFVSENPAFDISDTSVDFTFSMWYIPDVATGGGRCMFAFVTPSWSDTGGYSLYGGGADGLMKLRWNAASEITMPNLPRLKLSHIAWTRKATYNRLFVNGRSVTDTPFQMSFLSMEGCKFFLGKSLTFTLGHWKSSTAYYNTSAISDFWFLRGKALWFDSPFQPPMKQYIDRSSLIATPSIQQSMGVR